MRPWHESLGHCSTEDTSSCVYGCCGSSSTWSVRPASTTAPPRITIRRCATAHHTEIVRDEDRGEAKLVAQSAQQIEQPRLNRYIETAGRLVHKDEPRVGDHVAGDLQAPPHAAGEGQRRAIDVFDLDLDLGEPVHRCRADVAVMTIADRHQALADIGPRPEPETQPIARVRVDKTPIKAISERRAGSDNSNNSAIRPSRRWYSMRPQSGCRRVDRQLSRVVCRDLDCRRRRAPRPATARTICRGSRPARQSS